MKRLLNTFWFDIQLQFRNGFYYASGFVALVMIIMLKQLDTVNWAQLWPPVLLENLVVNAFYFLAGMILLEKGEGTLEAQVVTPLRPREYLLSKVLSLGLLSLLESLIIILAVTGPNFNWLWLVLGILLLITIYSLYGFFVVARYDSITDFILPSVVWIIWFSLPLLYYFNIWHNWIMFLHPLQAPLVLMQAAFEAVPVWYIPYGIIYSLVWVVIAYLASQKAFMKFIVAKEGTR
jgi:fluoroquinolone transport system permease protein